MRSDIFRKQARKQINQQTDSKSKEKKEKAIKRGLETETHYGRRRDFKRMSQGDNEKVVHVPHTDETPSRNFSLTMSIMVRLCFRDELAAS